MARKYTVETRLCKSCNKPFQAKKLQLFCNRLCSNDFHSFHGLTNKYGLSTGDLGSINELLVCVHLMKQRYSVFRNVSVNGKIDLVALKDNIFKKVQVTTGYKNKAGKISHPHSISEDILLAIVIGDGEEIIFK